MCPLARPCETSPIQVGPQCVHASISSFVPLGSYFELGFNQDQLTVSTGYIQFGQLDDICQAPGHLQGQRLPCHLLSGSQRGRGLLPTTEVANSHTLDNFILFEW